VIALGVILIIVGWLFGLGIILDIGVVLAVIGVILLILGATGHAVGGRRYYW
jgi:hypothetical protein